MRKNKDLQELFNNYKNLTEEQLKKLLELVVKQEKERLGISLPIRFHIGSDELNKKFAGGDASTIYNDSTNRYEHVVRLSNYGYYSQYLADRNKEYRMGDFKFESSLESLYGLISTLCHEIRHIYQHEQCNFKTEVTNPQALVWLKEKLIVTDEKFYRDSHNYGNMSRETDAYKYQYEEALEYVKMYTTIEKDNPKFYEKLLDTLDRWKSSYVKPFDELTFVVNGEEVKITEYFNKNMEETLRKRKITPEIIKGSILKYEYNLDGTPKTFKQLMDDKQKLIDSFDKRLSNYNQQVKKIEDIYNSIVENNIELQKQKQQLQEEKQNNRHDKDKSKQKEKAKTRDEVQINKDIKNAVENKESQSLDDIQTLRHGSIADLDSQYIIGDKEKGIPKHYLKVNEDGSWYEKWEYLLKETSDNGIGYQTITENWDSNKGIKTIVTESELENKDGKYTISEISEGNNDSYSVQKIVKGYNKRTGNNEQFFYAKDKQGNEYAYSKINGNISLRVSKNKNGTTIDKYDEKGQVIDSYTYDKEGKALIGFNGLDEISEDYVEKFIERVGKNIPQVYAEGVDLGTHANNQPIFENKGETASDREEVSTQKLGEETLDIQKSHKRMDDVENVVNQHRAERQQPTKESTTEYDKANFKDRMKAHIDSDEYTQEVLTKFTQDLENGNLYNDGQKNNDDYNPEKGDDDYVM